jgi:hypothetical protein
MFGELSDSCRFNVKVSGYFFIRGKLEAVSFRRSAADGQGYRFCGDVPLEICRWGNCGTTVGYIKWGSEILKRLAPVYVYDVGHSKNAGLLMV